MPVYVTVEGPDACGSSQQECSFDVYKNVGKGVDLSGLSATNLYTRYPAPFTFMTSLRIGVAGAPVGVPPYTPALVGERSTI